MCISGASLLLSILERAREKVLEDMGESAPCRRGALGSAPSRDDGGRSPRYDFLAPTWPRVKAAARWALPTGSSSVCTEREYGQEIANEGLHACDALAGQGAAYFWAFGSVPQEVPRTRSCV